MALEPYDPCPCGNGKKFKFCCQPIYDQLQAVERLIAERQPKQALIAAEKLDPQHSNNPLLMRNKIMALLMLERNDEALELIHRCEQVNPQDPFAYYFDIRWHLQASDWDHTRPLIEKHIAFIGERIPEMASQLAMEIVDFMLESGRFMAAWRYLFDALLWARTQERAQAVTSTFAELNRTTDIPLPYRNLYRLRALPENQPNQAEFAEAMDFVNRRSWTKAAQLFEALSEKDEHQPVFTYNAGFCYAWSGDLAAAAELLGRAADDLPDFEEAVQLETLAQLHEQMLPEEQLPATIYRYRVKSISRLLSQLDQEPRLYRQPQPPNQAEGEQPIAASYLLLNHPANDADISDLQSVAVAVASVVVMDEVREPEIPGELFFRNMAPSLSEADRELILRVAGEQIDLTPEEGWGLLEPEGGQPRDVAHLNFHIVPPQGMKRSDSLKLFDAHSRYVINEQWMQSPLSALDGLSPVEAAQDPDLHLPVCAAINVLACIADSVNFAVDVDELRQRLNLPAVEPLPIKTVDELRAGNIQDALRLSFMEVPVEVLPEAFHMLAGSRVMIPLRRLLEALYVREVALPQFDVPALCRMACGLATRCLDLDDAQTWIDRGREACTKAGADLMQRLEWDLTQLEVYALTGNEERLTELVRKCARDYFLKIPDSKSAIQMLLSAERIDSPQLQSIMSGTDLQTVGAGMGGGLWTPESAGAAPAGKLWVPGQE